METIKASKWQSIRSQNYLGDEFRGIVDVLLLVVVGILQQERQAAAAGDGGDAGNAEELQSKSEKRSLMFTYYVERDH